MAIDYRAGTKVQKNLRREEANASRVEPYPYIGIVKGNQDPTRGGRLQVWIPDLGGVEEDSNNWRTVGYSSPYMGYTPVESLDNTTNSFDSVQNSYGMWMVPPDIGVQVICLFIAGDPQRGYWISCVNPGISHHMTPAVGGSTNAIQTGLSGVENNVLPKPVSEFNQNDQKAVTDPSFYNNKKPIHLPQYDVLKSQGLDRDPIRGAIGSTSQRETPSNVFGISTPGRPYGNDPADDINYRSNLDKGLLSKKYEKIKSRKGGHSFVMDDGAVLGQDQLLRLRTAKGHQLLMHDSADSLYISHASGASWIELANDGQIKVYAKDGFSVRSGSDINLHSDKNINFNAGSDIKIKAGGKIRMESGSASLKTNSGAFDLDIAGAIRTKASGDFVVDSIGKISLRATSTLALTAAKILQNSGGAIIAPDVESMRVNQFPDTGYNKQLALWINQANLLESVVSVAPSHEPYARSGEGSSYFAPATATLTPQTTWKEAIDQTKDLAGAEVGIKASDVDLRNQPPATAPIGNLNENEVTAYKAQIGKSESSGKYDAVNEIGYVGKYQQGFQSLQDSGHVKSSVTSNAQLENPNSWVGKDGVSSRADFLNNETVQEDIMDKYTQRNYNAMVKNGAITKDMSKADVGGMLATAHLLGATGAKNWREGLGGEDANGTTGDQYFQKGKFATTVLATKQSDLYNPFAGVSSGADAPSQQGSFGT